MDGIFNIGSPWQAALGGVVGIFVTWLILFFATVVIVCSLIGVLLYIIPRCFVKMMREQRILQSAAVSRRRDSSDSFA